MLPCRQHTLERRHQHGWEWGKCFLRQFHLQTVGMLLHLSLHALLRCVLVLPCMFEAWLSSMSVFLVYVSSLAISYVPV